MQVFVLHSLTQSLMFFVPIYVKITVKELSLCKKKLNGKGGGGEKPDRGKKSRNFISSCNSTKRPLRSLKIAVEVHLNYF